MQADDEDDVEHASVCWDEDWVWGNIEGKVAFIHDGYSSRLLWFSDGDAVSPVLTVRACFSDFAALRSFRTRISKNDIPLEKRPTLYL